MFIIWSPTTLMSILHRSGSANPCSAGNVTTTGWCKTRSSNSLRTIQRHPRTTSLSWVCAHFMRHVASMTKTFLLYNLVSTLTLTLEICQVEAWKMVHGRWREQIVCKYEQSKAGRSSLSAITPRSISSGWTRFSTPRLCRSWQSTAVPCLEGGCSSLMWVRNVFRHKSQIARFRQARMNEG